MVCKSRQAFGERVNTAKLNADKVLAISVLFRNGFTVYQLGDMFGVDHSHVRLILSGKCWRSVKREIFASTAPQVLR